MSELNLDALHPSDLTANAIQVTNESANQPYGRRFKVKSGNSERTVVFNDLFLLARRLANEATDPSEMDKVRSFVVDLDKIESKAAQEYKDRDDPWYKFRTFFHRITHLFYQFYGVGSHHDRLERLERDICVSGQKKMATKVEEFFNSRPLDPIFKADWHEWTSHWFADDARLIKKAAELKENYQKFYVQEDANSQKLDAIIALGQERESLALPQELKKWFEFGSSFVQDRSSEHFPAWEEWLKKFETFVQKCPPDHPSIKKLQEKAEDLRAYTDEARAYLDLQKDNGEAYGLFCQLVEVKDALVREGYPLKELTATTDLDNSWTTQKLREAEALQEKLAAHKLPVNRALKQILAACEEAIKSKNQSLEYLREVQADLRHLDQVAENALLPMQEAVIETRIQSLSDAIGKVKHPEFMEHYRLVNSNPVHNAIAVLQLNVAARIAVANRQFFQYVSSPQDKHGLYLSHVPLTNDRFEGWLKALSISKDDYWKLDRLAGGWSLHDAITQALATARPPLEDRVDSLKPYLPLCDFKQKHTYLQHVAMADREKKHIFARLYPLVEQLKEVTPSIVELYYSASHPLTQFGITHTRKELEKYQKDYSTITAAITELLNQQESQLKKVS